MSGIRVLLVLVAVVTFRGSVVFAEALSGENLIEVKIELPNGDTYLHGATDPVCNLDVKLTLTNKSKKEDLGNESITVTSVKRLTGDELAAMHSETVLGKAKPEDHMAAVDKKKTTESIERPKLNKESLGCAYVEPQLGAHDSVEFIITKLPDEGEPAAENAKLKITMRDNPPDNISYQDVNPTLYLAAGETSPVYALPVGKYYQVREPGLYSIKALLRLIGTTTKDGRGAESNEEKFRVLPYKIVDSKIDEVKENIKHYERDFPKFDYMFYQVKSGGQYDEVWYAQRIVVRRMDSYEWTCLCTVKTGTAVQLGQMGSKKIALLAQHHKGDASLFTVDFSTPGCKVTTQTLAVKDGAAPKLKVEGGNATAE